MTATATAPTTAGPGPRRARLFVTRLDPWSVLKTSFVLSIGLAIVVIVASTLVWMLLSATGTFDSITTTIDDVGGSGATGIDIGEFFSFGRMIGFAFLVAAFEIVLTTALTTVMAAIYNVTVGFTGGVEVTLAEEA